MNSRIPFPVVLFLPFVAFLNGCATALLSSAPVTSTVVKQRTIDQDVVRAIGYPTNVGERVEGLVLLGDKYTYWITAGDKKIKLMAKQLNPKYIEMEDVTTIIVEADKFSGKLSFAYDNGGSDYSASEINDLNKLCTKEALPGKWFGFGKHVYYRCWIYVSGSLYSGRTSTFQGVSNLTKGRSVRLASIEESTTIVDSRKVVDKLTALPFTVAFDLLTLPLQVIFLWGGGK